MNQEKFNFIRAEFFQLLESLTPEMQGNWGKMNAQQMIEHVADFFNVSAGIIKFDLVTPAVHLPKFKDFLLSDKQFKENTKAPANVVGEEPVAVRCSSIQESIQWLKQAVDNFIDHFESDPEGKTMHPVFGNLNFDEWVQLHHKHLIHHLNQFGLLAKD